MLKYRVNIELSNEITKTKLTCSFPLLFFMCLLGKA